MTVETFKVAYVSTDVLHEMVSMIYGRGQWNVEMEDDNTIVVWVDIAYEHRDGFKADFVPPPTRRVELRFRGK